MSLIRSLYITQRFYLCIAMNAVLFLLTFWFPWVGVLARVCLLLLLASFFFDLILLYRFQDGITAKRVMADKLSNADENLISIMMENRYPFHLYVNVIDEVPFQFQKRDFGKRLKIKKGSKTSFEYSLIPKERGEYHFGGLNLYAASQLSLVQRRFIFDENQMVPVYPSYIQMKKYEFLAMSNRLHEFGIKKIRRIGHTMEFEQIKNYVTGDDVRTINWKATAKKNELMVNQYQDEKSQPIYSVIDKGRVMKMPFEGLKLLDYAINASLAFSNIALLKNDKAGMFSFSRAVENIVLASNKKTNLSLINEALYNLDTDFSDSDFGRLYSMVQRKITNRSLLILYTNFEHISALKRQMPYLKSMARKHLLLVVFFENTALKALTDLPVEDLQGIYEKTVAQQFVYDKKLMVKELKKNGIHAMLTAPNQLTVNVINQYLQFKSRGLV